VPFVVNFKLVDVDGNGKISEAEFKDGCKKGLVQQALNEGGSMRAAISTALGLFALVIVQPKSTTAPSLDTYSGKMAGSALTETRTSGTVAIAPREKSKSRNPTRFL
jgi:hypothetical protein